MKRLLALAATMTALSFTAPSSTAYANTHCNYGGGVTVGPSTTGIIYAPPGTYAIVPHPSDGADAIYVAPNPALGITGYYLRLSQLPILGVPFNVAQGGNPLQLTCGSPDSANFKAIADALDMDFDFDVEGDSDTIGGTATYWDMANENGQRFDLKYAKGMQLSEGSRTRLVLTARRAT